MTWCARGRFPGPGGHRAGSAGQGSARVVAAMVELANDRPFWSIRPLAGGLRIPCSTAPVILALVARAVELGMDTLAITDRDGLYGAVRSEACLRQGVAPVVGVDFAVAPASPTAVSRPITAARGGGSRPPVTRRRAGHRPRRWGRCAGCHRRAPGRRTGADAHPTLLAEHREPGGDSLLVMMGSIRLAGHCQHADCAEAELPIRGRWAQPMVIAVTDQLVADGVIPIDRLRPCGDLPTGTGYVQCSPTTYGWSTVPRLPPATSSTRPAVWCRWPLATLIAATPRAG